jgi:xanthine/uracil/vitamin C permease (AzgA family)
MIDKTIGVFIALIGLASLAVIVSKRSNTAKVLQALLGGFSSTVRAAVSPVTGK